MAGGLVTEQYVLPFGLCAVCTYYLFKTFLMKEAKEKEEGKEREKRITES